MHITYDQLHTSPQKGIKFCSPIAAFFSLLFTLHAISTAAAMTDTTMRMTTTATTAPMIAADPLPERMRPTLLPPLTATTVLLCRVDDSTAIGSCSDEDEKWNKSTVLGVTLVANFSDETAADVLRESGAVDVSDETEVLVTSGTAQRKYTSNCYTKA